MPTRFYITLPDPARGSDADLAFKSQGADGLASELQEALRSDGLFQRWRMKQEEPDEVDAALGASDANATVHGQQHDLKIDLVVITSLPSSILRQRLNLLAGSGWQLRDVSAA